MNPEVVAARNQYIEAKRISRGFWSNLGGNIRAGFGLWGERPDAAMRRLGAAYTERRNEAIIGLAIQNAQPAVNNTPEELANYRAQIGMRAATDLIAEMRTLSQGELDLNRRNRFFARAAEIYRRPWVRAGVGIGLNVLIGASAAAGLFPVTGGLILARKAVGTYGMEGALHGLQDAYTNNFGDRSRGHARDITNPNRNFNTPEERRRYLGDIAAALGSIDDERIRKNNNRRAQITAFGEQDADPNQATTTENYLQTIYRQRIAEVLSSVPLVNDPPTYVQNLRESLGLHETTNIRNEGALKTERRIQAGRWVGAAVLSHSLTELLTSEKIRDALGIKPVQPIELPKDVRVELPRVNPPHVDLPQIEPRKPDWWPGWPWEHGGTVIADRPQLHWPGWWWEHGDKPSWWPGWPWENQPAPKPDFTTMNYRPWNYSEGLPSAYGWGHNAIATHLFNMDLNNPAQNYDYHMLVSENPNKYNAMAWALGQDHLRANNFDNFITEDGFRPNTNINIYNPNKLTAYIRQLNGMYQ